MPASNLSVTLARHPVDLLERPGIPEVGQCDPRTSELLIRKHGGQSSSYFALQPACRHYYSQGLGLVPYVPVSVFGQRVNVVPTRPLARSRR